MLTLHGQFFGFNPIESILIFPHSSLRRESAQTYVLRGLAPGPRGHAAAVGFRGLAPSQVCENRETET